MKRILISLFLLGLFSCGKFEKVEQEETQPQLITTQSGTTLDIFYKSMTKLRVEVFYEQGSAPYTGTTALGKDYWDLFTSNIKKILSTEERGVDVYIPTQLSQMASFEDKNKASWSVSELQSLFSELGSSSSTQDTGYLSIIFLSGAFKDSNGEVKSNVLGIHITGTNRIVIFKDLMKSIEANENMWVARFSEQSVLIHEGGHALGMVNNGLPMSEEHQDSEHGAHCTNDKCVMYWLNEGRDGLKDFIQQYILTGSEIIWGEHCLQDAAKYRSN